MKYIKLICYCLILIIAISLVRPSKSEAKSFNDILTGGDIFTSSASDENLFNETNQKNAIDDTYYILLGIRNNNCYSNRLDTWNSICNNRYRGPSKN